jgi:hypothetical protein
MPREGTIAADIADYLNEKRDGATVAEIAQHLVGVRRMPVLRHSVRSAIQQHLDDKGSGLFVRVGRARYTLRK